MSLNYVTITETFDDGTGQPMTGTVTFTPSLTVYAAGVPVVTPASPIVAQVIAGALKSPSGGTLQLLATDNTGLTFEGLTGFFYWNVVVNVGGSQSWSFFLPHTPSTVDLYSLANTSASGGGFTSPMTTLGDIIYENATPAAARLAGSTSAAKNFLTQTGTGSVSAAPAWGTIAAGDVPQLADYAPTGLTGATSGASRYVGGTVTGPPTSGTFSAGDMTIDQTGAEWVAIIAGSPGVWARIGDPAGMYRPETYGGLGDGKLVSDGAMSSVTSTTTLTCATSTPFKASDVGKAILVHGAGTAGADLLTTISTFTDSGHVILAAAASTTVSATGVVYGTDNTAAIKSAQSAAVAYAQANPSSTGIVGLGNGIYCTSGAATTGGAGQGNSIFLLPIIATTAPKVTLVWKGAAPADALPHWLQTTPQMSGSVICSLNLSGTNNGTYGPAFVIGGPWNGYGGGTSTFSNMMVVVDGVQISTPFNGTYGGFGFRGMAEAKVISGSFMPLAIVPSGGAWPQFANGSITNTWTYGLQMPDVNNNDNCDVLYWSGYGTTYGFMPSEHTNALSVRCNYNIVGVQAYAGGATPHGAHIHYASVEANGQASGVLSTGASVKINIDQLDYEGPSQYVLFDTSNNFAGELRFRNVGTGYQTGLTNNTGTPRLINLDQLAGPVTSPQAPPANNAAWVNGYYRDAWITLSATTITALKIDATAQNGLAGSPASYTFLLPSGHSYTPTFTGALTHTVTLI